MYKAAQAVGLGQAARLGDQVVLHERNIDAAARQLAPEGSHEQALTGHRTCNDGALIHGVAVNEAERARGDGLEGAAQVQRAAHAA